MTTHSRLARAATVVLGLLVCAPAGAEPSKEECVSAHSQGQDAKDAGKLSLARKLFMTCAQAACPAVVQNDCARFADDLARMQPSISFIARDAAGNDLPDTSVYVDGMLVVTRLDDGRPHDVDPGKHVVKFTNSSGEQEVTVVVGSGEKGRPVIANFKSGAAGTGGGHADASEPRKPKIKKTHPAGSRVVTILGAVVGGAGTTLAVIGYLKVPGNCSITSHECAAPPGDEAFDKASSGVKIMDIGIAIGAIGIAATAGGLTWYITGAKTEKPDAARVGLKPWFSGSGGGIALTGKL
jgi:hypothetical protein